MHPVVSHISPEESAGLVRIVVFLRMTLRCQVSRYVSESEVRENQQAQVKDIRATPSPRRHNHGKALQGEPDPGSKGVKY